MRKEIGDSVAALSQSALSGGSRVMDLEVGDRVQVNLAPFIGAASPCHESILCTVSAVHEGRVQVRTEPPYREVVLWVASSWVEGHARKKRPAPHFAAAGRQSFADCW
jgi:hypothetical protein